MQHKGPHPVPADLVVSLPLMHPNGHSKTQIIPSIKLTYRWGDASQITQTHRAGAPAGPPAGRRIKWAVHELKAVYELKA
eukprot:scaffold198295_cov20-Tisochrysis_lutea.AAC.1